MKNSRLRDGIEGIMRGNGVKVMKKNSCNVVVNGQNNNDNNDKNSNKRLASTSSDTFFRHI